MSENRGSKHVLTRRTLIGGASAVGLSALTPWQGFGQDDKVDVENLGPGVLGYSGQGGKLVGDTMFVGSRNLEPSRVVGYHVPSGQVTESYTLGTGHVAEGLAAYGSDVLYAGVVGATNTTNLYRCDRRTGEVTGVANVPGMSIRDLAVAPDGVVYIVGRPQPFAAGPPVYSYDPATGELVNLGVPDRAADQGYAVDVTNTTVYYGCNSVLTSRTGGGLYAIDRASGEITLIRAGNIRNHHVRVLGDVVAVGGHPGGGDDWFGVFDLVDGSWREMPGTRAPVGRRGDALIVLGGGELSQVDLNTWTLEQIGEPGLGATGRGLLDDLAVGVTGYGWIWTFDIGTGEFERHDLVDAGAQGGPLLGSSVGVVDTADGTVAYLSGANITAIHDLAAGSVTNAQIPTEAKDMIAANGLMYMAVYSSGSIWEHDPAKDEPPRRVADLPEGQNRPYVARWDEENELVVIVVQADDTREGSLCLYEPATGTVTAHINPLGAQPVHAAATGHGLVYIGGSAGSTDLAAWDPLAGEEVWRIALDLGEGVSSLVALGRRLFGITNQGRFFVVDLTRSSDPVLVHEELLGTAAGRPRLLVDRGLIYGASSRSVFRIDPVTYEARVLVDNLGAEWFAGPRLAFDTAHNLYTLAGHDLVRIRDRSPR